MQRLVQRLPKRFCIVFLKYEARRRTSPSCRLAIDNRIGEAASLAQSFSASSSGEAAGQVAWLEQEAAQAAELLGGVDRRLNDALALLDKDGPAVIKYLAEAADRLAGHDTMSEAIEDAALRMAELGSDRAMPLAGSRPLLGVLRKAYTMEAERKIHDRFAGAAPVAAIVEDVADLLF